MISYKPKVHLISRADDSVLQRLANPHAPGNEGMKWLAGYAAEMRDLLRAQTENLNTPVLDAELRQVRGALHVLGILADSELAAKAILTSRAAGAAKQETNTQP
jgi:hypothetical protein